MIAVEHVPAPAGAPAGAAYFHCAHLSATLSTQACASRWSAAVTGSACKGCAVGRQHHAGAPPQKDAALPKQQRRQQECMRCHRTDLRIIAQRGLCVSCANREYEWRAGRNAKGKAPPCFAPLTLFAVAIEGPAGQIVHHAIEARHAAEAVGVVALRRLAEGARLSHARPGETKWSAEHGRLVVACPACGHAGLLERQSRGTLRHHCLRCGGAATGLGWVLARPRAGVTLWPAAIMAVWLHMTDELPPAHWTSTEFGCESCRTAVLQARSPAKGRVEASCPACGDHAAHAH